MDASNQCSSALALTLSLLVGCQDRLGPIEGPSSLVVEVVEPSGLGTPDARLGDGTRSLTVNVHTVDAYGQLDTSITGKLEVFVYYQGSRLAPRDTAPAGAAVPRFAFSDEPIGRIELVAGRAERVSVALPPVYGPSLVWIEDVAGEMARAPSYATGTSDTLWYRDPFIADLSAPFDEAAADAFEMGKLNRKQVMVTGSRYGARGRLVVTGAYSDGFTLSDVECQDEAGTPPCRSNDYDHVFIYSYSEGRYEEGGGQVAVGQTVARVGGSVTEFNGLTELNFPQVFVRDATPRPELVPEPILIQAAWLSQPIQLERREAGLLLAEGGKVCPLDDAWQRFGQWKLDVGNGCGKAISVVTRGVVAGFDPTTRVGTTIRRVVGALKPVNIGNFHVWIIYPRGPGDLTP